MSTKDVLGGDVEGVERRIGADGKPPSLITLIVTAMERAIYLRHDCNLGYIQGKLLPASQTI